MNITLLNLCVRRGTPDTTRKIMEQYKINFKTQWANGWQILGFALVSIIGIKIGTFLRPNADNLFTMLFSIAFLCQFLPQLALHLNYYLVNKNDILKYDDLHKQMEFTHEGRTIRFYLDDIEQIVLYKSFALNRKDIQLLAWDSYNHAVVKLNSGTKITVTSLLTGLEIMIPVEPQKIKLKLNLYRWANGPSLVKAV